MSGVRKPRPLRKPRVPRTPGQYHTTTGAIGGGRLEEAAQEIADAARDNAAWSKQIPGSITVEIDGNVATISSGAPPAYPAETRTRHPLFGLTGAANDIRIKRGRLLMLKDGFRGWWYPPPGKPFLRPALDDRAGPALAKYARKVDDWCRERGFK